ncbi:MAG: alkaline phosphatase family protein [Candidatus Omnitrophota bacterium]
MGQNKPRVIVIGLDGATWTNLKPWMGQGLLPNLKFLVDNGVNGELKSTIPPQSALAWSSFMTGVNPGKHGIFGFVKPFKDKRYETEIVTSSDMKTKTIFEILSDNKKISGVINLPITYPPLKINGFMVSCGLTTPSVNCNFTYPDDLFEKNRIERKEYILSLRWKKYSEKQKDKFFSDLIKCEGKRKEVSFKLMNKYDWDLFVVVFGGTDWLQHFCWHYIDPKHSKYNQVEANKFLPTIIKYYTKIDSIIGEFISLVDENTSLFIISDHGFGPREKRIDLHKLLENGGFLHYRKMSRLSDALEKKVNAAINKIRGTLHRHSFLYRKGKVFAKIIYRKIKAKTLKNDLPKENSKRIRPDIESSYLRKINWQRTFFYSGYPDDTGYINLKGREPEGIINSNEEYQQVRERVINLIDSLSNPENGRKLKVKIYKGEEIYKGPYARNGYDLCFDIEDETYDLRCAANLKNIFNDIKTATGKHTRDGIILCYGKNFKKEYCIKGAQILDIAPTIFYLLGVPLPDYFDGKVLKDAISNEYLIYNPIEQQKIFNENTLTERDNNTLNEEDTSKVKKRLADLGYI